MLCFNSGDLFGCIGNSADRCCNQNIQRGFFFIRSSRDISIQDVLKNSVLLELPSRNSFKQEKRIQITESTMPYCANCGTEISRGAGFCASCGARVGSTSGNPASGSATGEGNPFELYYIGIFRKYAVFSGRARRKEYWMFYLFNFLVSFILGFIDGFYHGYSGTSMQGIGVLNLIYSLIAFLPSVGVSIRRMHDVNKSGWFILVPIYNLILLLTDGTRGDNRFGSDPKGR